MERNPAKYPALLKEKQKLYNENYSDRLRRYIEINGFLLAMMQKHYGNCNQGKRMKVVETSHDR